MKKSLLSLLIIIALGATAFAQEAGSEHHPQQRLESITEHLSKALDLTPEQREKLQTVLKEQHRLREEDQARHKAEREEMKKKLAEFLSPEQMAKMEKMHEERQSQRKGKRLHKSKKEE